jgi:hypothetical protein
MGTGSAIRECRVGCSPARISACIPESALNRVPALLRQPATWLLKSSLGISFHFSCLLLSFDFGAMYHFILSVAPCMFDVLTIVIYALLEFSLSPHQCEFKLLPVVCTLPALPGRPQSVPLRAFHALTSSDADPSHHNEATGRIVQDQAGPKRAGGRTPPKLRSFVLSPQTVNRALATLAKEADKSLRRVQKVEQTVNRRRPQYCGQ